MKDYSVLDNMIRMVGDTIKQAFDKGYKQGYTDGKDEAYKNPVPTQDAYQRGLDDAWEAARIIYGMNKDTRLVTTAFVHYETVFDNYSASEAIAKIKEYEEKQTDDEIRVGDEVYIKTDGCKGIVWGIEDVDFENFGEYLVFGGTSTMYHGEHLEKTGRHFDQIEEVLKQMQEDKE